MESEQKRGSFKFGKTYVSYSNQENKPHTILKRNYPFNDIYWQIINQLENLGYNVGYSSYYDTNFTLLKKDHYRADKSDVCLIFSRYPAGFKIEIENVKNHMISSDSFWHDWNDKYISLNYLENKRIELAIKHIKDFIDKRFYNSVNINEKNPTDPIKNLFYNEKINNHIHGGAQTWEELKAYVDKNEPLYNCKDKHGNKLVCGETKYFYSDAHNNRLCKAEVWHHINNMWWALINGQLYNEASFRFFDFDKSLPKKNPEKAISKINKLIKHHESKMEYEKCIALRNALNKISQ